jgi:hypothetical protein
MPIPTLITDLSQTAGSNYPAGSDSPSVLDDTQRSHASFIAQLRDGKGHTNQVTLASATIADIGGQNSMFVEISGTTTITSFGTNYNGPRFLRFSGALTLTHNASTLILPDGANITTAAGDTCIALPTSGGWYVSAYSRVGSSNLILSAANGYGSTNGAIKRYSTVLTYQGTDITYVDSAALGASITINTPGVYAISMQAVSTPQTFHGFSLNTTQPTLGLPFINTSDILAMTTATANFHTHISQTRFFPSGSVIRPHTYGDASSAPAFEKFIVTGPL